MIDERDLRAQRQGFSTHRDRMQTVLLSLPTRPSHCARCGRKLEYAEEVAFYICVQCGYSAPLAARENDKDGV